MKNLLKKKVIHETVGGSGWSEHLDAETGKRIAILPSLRIVVVELEDGKCAILPLEAKGIGDGGAEVKGSVGETADKLARAGLGSVRR